MTIRWSPGCNCCADDPSCELLYKKLTNDAGTSLNTTDWSFTGGTPTVDSSDTIDVASGTTITPLFTMDTNAAYYVRLRIKPISGSTPTVSIKMGSNTAKVDLSASTCQINSIGARDLPTYDPGEDVFLQAYFCPTHSMAEASGIIESTAHAGYPVTSYGATTVDSANPTVTQSWTVEVTGDDAQISEITYRPADVEYTGSTKTQDCGRSDIFPNFWEFFDEHSVQTQADGVSNINLSVTSGTDITVTAPYTARFWGTGSFPSDTQTNEPVDMGVLLNYPLGLGIYSIRCEKYNAPPWTFRYPTGNFLVYCLWYVSRDMPTSSTPYPEPTARKFIAIGTQQTSSPFSEIINATNEDDHGNIPDPVPTFTVSVSDGSRTVEWDHPYP